jgi:hypothetical protein
MNRLVWLPTMTALLLLVAVAVNTNLGHWVPFSLDEHAMETKVLVGIVSFCLYDTALMVTLWRIIRAPGRRAATAAGVTMALGFVLTIAGEMPGGGFLHFTWKDIFVDFPGYAALNFADELVLYAPLDPERCNPLAWEKAGLAPAQEVRRGRLLRSGVVMLETLHRTGRGMFDPIESTSLVALRPDGALDRAFTERFHRCVDGALRSDGDRLLLLQGAKVAAVVEADGRELDPAALAQYTEALRAFEPQWREGLAWPHDELLVSRPPGAGGGRTVATFSMAGPQLTQTGHFALGPLLADPQAWRSYAHVGEELLVVQYKRSSPRGYEYHGDGRPILEVLADQVLLLRPDGSRDPAFHLELPAELVALLEPNWNEVQKVWGLSSNRLLLDFEVGLEHGTRTILLTMDSRGTVSPDPWIEVDGMVAAAQPLDDGRIAVVQVSGARSSERIGIVPAHGRHHMADRSPADGEAVGIRTDGDVVDLSLAATALDLGADGRLLLLSRKFPGALGLIDARGTPIDGFQAPSWLNLGD